MEGLRELTVRLHYSVDTRTCDGARLFDGEILVGSLSLKELLKITSAVMDDTADRVAAGGFKQPAERPENVRLRNQWREQNE
jgi:hypothetical protein